MCWIAVAFAGAQPAVVSYRPGKGARIESADHRFGIAIKSRIQLRETLTLAPNEVVPDFELWRVRLDFSGFALKVHHWRFQLGFEGNGDNSPLLDGYYEFVPYGSVKIRVGQYKVAFGRERFMSTSTLQFVERSSLDGEFRIGRDRGAQVTVSLWKPDGEKPRFHAYIGAYYGNGRHAGVREEPGGLVVARFDFMPLGAFDYYKEADLIRSQQLRLGIGGAVSRLWAAPKTKGVNGSAPEDGGSTDINIWTADVGMRWAGISVDGAITGRSGQRHPGALAGEQAARSGLGWSAQVGAVVPKIPLGMAVRYAQILPDQTSSLTAAREMGGSVSYYIAGHPYDITADIFRIEAGDQVSTRARLQLELSL